MANLQLIMPQEIEVYYIIPTIRKYFAVFMKEKGISQKEIASLLCIQESTVSQYLSNRRASLIKFSENIENEIRKSASQVKNQVDLVRETNKVLKLIRETGEICSIHKKIANIPEKCTPEITGCGKLEICH